MTRRFWIVRIESRLIGGGETRLLKTEAYGPYFSVFPLGQEVFGFNIEGAKYPLREHTLTPYDSLCVSNQIEGGSGDSISGWCGNSDGDS